MSAAFRNVAFLGVSFNLLGIALTNVAILETFSILFSFVTTERMRIYIVLHILVFLVCCLGSLIAIFITPMNTSFARFVMIQNYAFYGEALFAICVVFIDNVQMIYLSYAGNPN